MLDPIPFQAAADRATSALDSADAEVTAMEAWAEAAVAEHARLQVVFDDTFDALTDAQGQAVQDAETIVALRAEVARLQALLDQDTYAGPMIGAATTQPGTTHFPILEQTLGTTLGIRRVFQPGAPKVTDFTWDLSQQRSVCYSFKAMPADGGRAFVRSAVAALTPPKGRLGRWARRWRKSGTVDAPTTVWLAWRHEPEDDKDMVTAEQKAKYRRDQAAFARVVAEETAGKPVDIHVLWIGMEYTAQTYSGRNWRDWFDREMYDAGIRTIGWDIYQPWYDDVRKFQTFEQRVAALDRVHSEIAAEIGAVVPCFPEIGHPEVPGQSTMKAQWLLAAHVWLALHGGPFMTYFNYVSTKISSRVEFLLRPGDPATATYADIARYAPR